MAARQRIVIDCDPGVDDAVAIALAFASPELEILALTTVGGNAGIGRVTANAMRVLQLLGRGDVPVHRGAWRPISRPVEHVWLSVHGDDGLGDTGRPDAGRLPERADATRALLSLVRAEPGAITICAIGPLTNVALAILADPAFAPAVGRIVWMGGAAFVPGNATPLAEFNAFVDPDAAAIVFDSGIPLTMLGLDATRKAVAPPGWREALAASGAIGAALAAMIAAYDDPGLHDPCAVARIVRPDLFTGVEAHLSILTQPAEARGKTIAALDAHHRAGRAPNADVVTDCDAPALLAFVGERLCGL